MLKKSLTILMALVFALGILTTSVLRTSAQTSSENYKIVPVVEEGQGASKSGQDQLLAENQEVDYFLAYPGILPDHFLYSLKMIRDRLRLWLTIDPLKKAELFLLYADKRLGAGRALIEGNKIELGVSTLTKGEKYLEQAAAQAKIARDKGKETRESLEKISQASLKHEEVLLDLQAKVGQSFQSTVEQSLSYTKQVREKVRQSLNQ